MYGGKEALTALRDIWRTSGNLGERYAALESMGCASSRESVREVLDYYFTDEVRTSEVSVFAKLSTRDGAAFDWITDTQAPL